MKKIIIFIAVVVVVILIAFQTVLKKEENGFETVDVVRGTVSQEVSETGQVKKGEEISLTFKNSGRIGRIYIEVGEEVNRGDLLAKLETTDLAIQLKQAEAALAISQAQLSKLLAGASQEEIKVAQTKVNNSQISLNTKKQDLANAYEDALTTLDAVYLTAYNCQNTVDSIQRTYFTENSQEGIKVKESKAKIESAASKIKSYTEALGLDASHEDINSALSQIKNELSGISSALKTIREICEDPLYRDVVSSANKTALDTHRANINTAVSNITSDQQLIISAQFSVDSAEGVLKSAQDELDLLIAPVRQEDIALYQAQVDQARAQVDTLKNKIEEAYLYAPVSGQITDVKKKEGELALQDVVATILPIAPFEIEVDIYEEDIVKVDIDDPVEISLVAFPDDIFMGRVISIDPAEKLIDGVVHYETTVNFEEMPDGLRAGMTADLVIKTATRENVLMISEDVILKKDGKNIVQVLSGGNVEDREVEIGLEGSDDMFEIISGLNEGEKAIIQ